MSSGIIGTRIRIISPQDAEGMSSFTWQAEGSGTSGLGRDDSQVKIPAFGKVLGMSN